MLKLVSSIVIALISTNTIAQPPSEESIESLFGLMNSKQIVEDSLHQIDATLQSSLNKSIQGKSVTEYQISIVSEAKGEISELIRSELSWKNMKPVFIESYQKTFNQDEVNGIIEFYKTESGQALLTKMPTAINTSVQLMQAQLKDMTPELNKIRQAAINKIKQVNRNPDLEVGKGIVSKSKRNPLDPLP